MSQDAELIAERYLKDVVNPKPINESMFDEVGNGVFEGELDNPYGHDTVRVRFTYQGPSRGDRDTPPDGSYVDGIMIAFNDEGWIKYSQAALDPRMPEEYVTTDAQGNLAPNSYENMADYLRDMTERGQAEHRDWVDSSKFDRWKDKL